MKKGIGKEKYRTEKDAIGDKRVLAERYYGIFTARALENFDISGITMPIELRKAYIEIKMAAALANMRLNVLDSRKGNAIVKACKKLLSDKTGEFDEEFVIDVYQAGAGTPWHMNVNEVIANLGLEIIGEKKGNYGKLDPHDDVNLGMSSNDVTPSAIRIACVRKLYDLVLEFEKFISVLGKKSEEFKSLIKVGRTHLMDAVPITLGEEFGIWKAEIVKRLKDLVLLEKNLYELPLGGTAVGTGFNSHPRFGTEVIKELRKITGMKFFKAERKGVDIQFMSDFVNLSGALRGLAIDVGKISNDIRLLGSGPMTGLNEIKLPEVEEGSSIMPGKFNPSMAEMMNQICYQVVGNDETIQRAGASGELELNFMTPVIAFNLFFSLEILKSGLKQFNEKCLKGIKANKKVLRKYSDKNLGIATVLNPILGYERTAEVVKEAFKKKKGIKEIVLEKKLLTEKEADRLFRR